MQVILGAGGVIATEIARCLPSYTDRIRLVSRHPHPVNESDEVFTADVTDPEQTRAATRGADVVYLAVGLPYDTEVWQQTWPVVMNNAIAACEENAARLVFFDNVYMYGAVDGWMTEDTPSKPVSRKGEVRARIADAFLEAVASGRVQGLVARSADFYGKTALSAVSVLVLDKLAKGGRAQILLDAETKHSYTFIPDAGRAAALLGNTDSAYGQVWHLPTDRNVLTGRELVEEAARAFGVPARYGVLRKWMLRMASWFDPMVAEGMEMLYQNDRDYLFSSAKFESAFHAPTAYPEGLARTAALYRES